MDLHEGLLEEVSEKIPVLFSKGSCPQAPLDTGTIDKDRAYDDS